MLQLAIVTHYYFPVYGGMQTQLHLLGGFLAANGVQITVFTSKPDGTSSFEDSGGVRIRRFGKTTTTAGLHAAYSEIHAELSKGTERFDVLYMPLGVGAKYPLEPQLDIIAFFLSIDVPIVIRITSSGRVAELCRKSKRAQALLRQCSRVVALNPGITDELLCAGVPASALFAIPNGVDIHHFSPVATPSADHLTRPLRFLYPCRICAKKDVSGLIDDWRRARQLSCKFRDVRLWILGDDNYHTEDPALYGHIEHLARTNNDFVTLTRSVPFGQMPNFYNMASLVLSSSHQEGMSNAALEAMACGLPLIAPDTEAFRPLLHDSPNFSYTCDADRIQTLIIARNREEEWSRIGSFNRKRVVEDFNADDILARYLSLFGSLVASV
jgi:glycosyltransferase involved in cell wall biosynthesis